MLYLFLFGFIYNNDVKLKYVHCNKLFDMAQLHLSGIKQEQLADYEKDNICSTVCQCCCSSTNLKCLNKSFQSEDQEVYCDMLYFCFSISIDVKINIPMICDECIVKLRESYAFKLQIESAQVKLKNQVAEEFKSKVDYSETFEVQTLAIKDEKNSDFEADCNDDSNETIYISELKKKLKTSRKRKRKLKKNEKDALTCKTCQQNFDSKKSFSSHMKTHTQLFICHVCGRESPSKKLLLSHVISHNTEKEQCHVCKKFLKKASLPRHLQQHTGNALIYACKVCPEKFTSYNTRLYHLIIAHGIDDKKYPCKVCDKVFRFSGGLSTHVKRCHLQEKKCVCSECDKSFFSKNELVKHMLKHTKIRAFQCEVCLKTYGRKSTLQAHIKIHSNVKQHKCPICFREFTQKCTLNCHMKVHEKMNLLKKQQDNNN